MVTTITTICSKLGGLRISQKDGLSKEIHFGRPGVLGGNRHRDSFAARSRSFVLQRRCTMTEGGNNNNSTLNVSPGHVLAEFSIKKKTDYGVVFAIVGSEPTLGNWNVKHAKKMKWSDSNVWGIEVELPADRKVEYKYIKMWDDSKKVKEWQPGKNLEVAVPPAEDDNTPPIIQVCDVWSGKGRMVSVSNQRSDPDGAPVRAPVVDTSVPFSSNPEAVKAAEYVAVAAARIHAELQAKGEGDGAYEGDNNYRDHAPSANGRDSNSNEHDVRATAHAPNAAAKETEDEIRKRLSSLRVADLRTMLRELGAPLSGKKIELVDRLIPILQEDDQGEDEENGGFEYVTPVVADDWPGNLVKEVGVETSIPEILYNNNDQSLEERLASYSNGVKNGQAPERLVMGEWMNGIWSRATNILR